MNSFDTIERPSKEGQRMALESYDSLSALLSQIKSDKSEIEETGEKTVLSGSVLKLLADTGESALRI